MKYCEQCGTPLSNDAKFCSGCGHAAAPAPQHTPVYTPPVYVPPVYTAPPVPPYVPAPPKPERKQVLNLAALICAGICFLLWLVMPFAVVFYDVPTASQIFFSMFSGGIFHYMIDDAPLALVPFFSFIFISGCLICTLCKKMISVRIFAIIHSALTSFLLFMQIGVEPAYVEYSHIGFWGVHIGMFVLIFLSGKRYQKA